jgi:hypothetical protein
MHPEIFSKSQVELLPYIKRFQRSFYMVGGTAIALHLGHRRSIDFDLFTPVRLVKHRIKNKLKEIPYNQVALFEDYDQLHLSVNNVKVTFFSFPYPIEHEIKVDSLISIPSLITLASMKAFALGGRAKWKDYVDLYFILKDHYTIKDISKAATINFGQMFSEKLFREQLAFHKDIDYSEPVEYLSTPVAEPKIKEFLIEKAIDIGPI